VVALSEKSQYGRYKVLKTLGKGSMSTVYHAVDPLLGREVAVKVIHPQLCRQPGFIKRFEREAMALARLEHPNIISIYDMGQEGEVFYMVIRLLGGGTLKDRLVNLKQANKLMPLADVDQIMVPMCDAVDYFHRSGFIHRDLKPSNLMFDDQENLYIADFGIVKSSGWESFTSVGGILGTPFYMSPEQFSGNIDHRTDIYSLGVILYEMCTGMLPFKGTIITDVIKAHLNQQPPPPDQINPSLPNTVVRVILKAMAKSPNDRFQTAAEMAHALELSIPRVGAVTGKDTVPMTDVFPKQGPVTHSAYLKSLASGARYKLQPNIDNRIGRSRPDKIVEVDLSPEKGSEFVHSTHAVVRTTPSGWEIEALSNIENPIYVNNKKLKPSEKVALSNGDRITFSVTKLVLEIG
jgi:serine/threonine-protein kinase